MKKFILIIACLFLIGCDKTPLQTVQTNNPNISVSLLFEYDGVRVYRFEDGYTRYFARVVGEPTVKTMDTHYVSQGKTGYTYNNDIETAGGKWN